MADSPPIYTVYTLLKHGGISVSCPNCGREAILKQANNSYLLSCRHCHISEIRSLVSEVKAAKGCCKNCARWFNIKLPLWQNSYPFVKISCPYCQQMQTAQTFPVGTEYHSPLEGLSLYFIEDFRKNKVWALNREHLSYLISYISADLREKYSYVYLRQESALYYGAAGQSQHLPRFMKSAKNREALLKILKRLEKK